MTRKLNIDKAYNDMMNRRPAGNSIYKKMAVQWLNGALCFVSSSVVVDSFRLRNRQLLVAASRWATYKKPTAETGTIGFC